VKATGRGTRCTPYGQRRQEGIIGGTSSLTGKVIKSTAAGCVVELVPEGEPRESRARRIFYPWTAIRSVELLEGLSDGRRPTDVPPPFEPPECPAT
jgi:hypothetical protein